MQYSYELPTAASSCGVEVILFLIDIQVWSLDNILVNAYMYVSSIEISIFSELASLMRPPYWLRAADSILQKVKPK